MPLVVLQKGYQRFHGTFVLCPAQREGRRLSNIRVLILQCGNQRPNGPGIRHLPESVRNAGSNILIVVLEGLGKRRGGAPVSYHGERFRGVSAHVLVSMLERRDERFYCRLGNLGQRFDRIHAETDAVTPQGINQRRYRGLSHAHQPLQRGVPDGNLFIFEQRSQRPGSAGIACFRQYCGRTDTDAPVFVPERFYQRLDGRFADFHQGTCGLHARSCNPARTGEIKTRIAFQHSNQEWYGGSGLFAHLPQLVSGTGAFFGVFGIQLVD